MAIAGGFTNQGGTYLGLQNIVNNFTPPPRKIPFKSGDKVRILNRAHYQDHLRLEIGEECEVIGVDQQVVVVKNDKGIDCGFWDRDHPDGVSYFLELVVNKAPVAERIKEFMVKDTITKHTILGQDKIKSQLDIAINKNMPVLLVGDTGTGKTTLIKDLADQHEKQWIRFNLTGETTVDEFVGKYTLKNENTVWEDGVLLTAMRKGYWLIVDEVNVALPEILFVLHSLLDDDRSVMVSTHNGEVVKPHKNFRFFGTMNPVDEYAGTKDLNKAFKSRFGMILNLEYPKPNIETTIVHLKGGADMKTASKIVDTAVLIRKAKKDNKVFYTCSTRDLIQWAMLTDDLGLKDAFEVSILNKSEGDNKILTDLFKKVETNYVKAETDGHPTNLETVIELSKDLERERREFDSEKKKLEKVKEKILDKVIAKEDKLTKKELTQVALEGELV